jgi:hypothetical protein
MQLYIQEKFCFSFAPFMGGEVLIEVFPVLIFLQCASTSDLSPVKQ